MFRRSLRSGFVAALIVVASGTSALAQVGAPAPFPNLPPQPLPKRFATSSFDCASLDIEDLPPHVPI